MDKETIAEIESKIKTILVDVFKDANKQQILKYEDRLNFACPYCGDSLNVRKRRGNLYLHNLSYHCFNCNTHSDYIHLLKDFDIPVGSSLSMAENILNNNKPHHQQTFDLYIFDLLNKVAFSREEIKRKLRLTEIQPKTKIYDYLASRCLTGHLHQFLYNSYRNELYVLNLTNENKICGLQIRSFDPNSVKYRTYNIGKLYDRMERKLKVEDDELNILNQVSMTYNLMKVDLFEDIYVFEGGMDSFFLKNSIGLCGVGRCMDLVENLNNTIYFFDNDESGYKQTVKKLKEGKRVFLWSKFLKSLSIEAPIKDLNELVVYMVKNKIKFDFKNINDFVSGNELDLIYL